MDAGKNESNTDLGTRDASDGSTERKGSGVMDTERGGESTQYESIKTQTVPPPKAYGQLGSTSDDTDETDQAKDERAEQTAANIRYGQNISEFGMGGQTNSSIGSAGHEGGYGGTPAEDEERKNTRREQGYGPGNNVGA